MLYFCVSRIFDEISFLKLWTIKKIIKKWTKKSKYAYMFLNFYPKILIVWLLERALNSDHKYIIYWGIWKSRFFENLGCIFDEKCVKPSIETFLKKIAKIQFFEENQCRTMLYFCISRIFDKISFLKLWTIKKIIKKWTKKSKDAHKFLNFYPKILIVWLLERA